VAVWRAGLALLCELAYAGAAAWSRHDESLKENSARPCRETPEPQTGGRGQDWRDES